MKRHRIDMVVVGRDKVTLDQIVAVACGAARVELSDDSSFRQSIEKSRAMLHQALSDGAPIYGVSTGYGKSCGKRLKVDRTLSCLGDNLIRFHGCGTGESISIPATRAAMLCRLLCLARGYSGVSMGLLERLADFLNLGITPVVPCEGSVGASGDLTPMSYIAAAMAGEREVFYRGRRLPAAEALELTGLPPYVFAPKEAIAMMNGTSTMTGIAALVVDRARRILDAAVCATALVVHALKGKVLHYHAVVGEAKPFPGQIHVAARLTEMLQSQGDAAELESCSPDALQDPYSLRCAPQIAGVLFDALGWVRTWVETEANSANDNPIFDPETGQPIMSGNFYGGHMAFAMDALKAAVASIADMSDRQTALLVDPLLNRGLPADLVRAAGEDHFFHHGFKAMSIATSALAAEALKLTMPAASFSRSTESNNQDKVSMGTIAARDAERICTLTQRVLAINLLAAVQGCELRGKIDLRPRLYALISRIRSLSDPLLADRQMDQDIERIALAIVEEDMFAAENDAG